ncbi:hypothetical protein [Methylobacterium sp. WSM2598]|uniref:hypothetical protein n=1 Tax=Methylobacterium sp. WSM2598 TaxID=398261 RepID=UPI00038103B3|nr:hypothetical protein [Methylobacterium sp. WSM2598]
MRACCLLTVAFLFTVPSDDASAASDLDRFDDHVSSRISTKTIEAHLSRIQDAFRRARTSWYHPVRYRTAFPTLGR